MGSLLKEIKAIASHVRRYFFPEPLIYIQPDTLDSLDLIDKVLYLACAVDDVALVSTMIANKSCHKNKMLVGDNSRKNGKISETPMTVAARHGSARVLRRLCQQSPITVSDSNTHTPLYHAVKNNHPECVKILLEQRSDPRDDYVAGAKLFDRHLVRFGSLYKMAMKQGGEVARLFQETDKQWQLLHAVGSRDIDRVRQLLQDKTCDINFTDAYGKTPLMKAAYGGQYDIAKMLLENGADTEKKDVYGHAAVFHAHSMEMIELLAKHEAVLYDKREGSGHTLDEFMDCVLTDKSLLGKIKDMAAQQEFNHMAMTKKPIPKLKKITVSKKPKASPAKLPKMKIIKKPPQSV